jgi:hypothetical protein
MEKWKNGKRKKVMDAEGRFAQRRRGAKGWMLRGLLRREKEGFK